MASIIKASINLNNIPKDKIYNGKKGKYLPITITLNDEIDQFGGSIKAIESNFQQNKIAESSYQYQQKVENKSQIIVGTNQFIDDEQKNLVLANIID